MDFPQSFFEVRLLTGIAFSLEDDVIYMDWYKYKE